MQLGGWLVAKNLSFSKTSIAELTAGTFFEDVTLPANSLSVLFKQLSAWYLGLLEALVDDQHIVYVDKSIEDFNQQHIYIYINFSINNEFSSDWWKPKTLTHDEGTSLEDITLNNFISLIMIITSAVLVTYNISCE